ncbi:MAG: hypothetical protein LBF49_01060 [Puniceicoccales bacterium]|nr:hypothetical protein [Puniceicoccales bacterium]
MHTTVNVARGDATSSTSLQDRNSRIKTASSIVAEFLGRMGNAQGGNFDLKRAKDLVSRLAVPTGPQGTADAPDVEALVTELEDLAKNIQDEESKIELKTKISARLKTLFSGKGAYEAAIAKKVFSKIKNESTKSTLLALTFEAAVSSKSFNNTQANVQTVLKFCQAAKVDENAIVKSINTIPNPDDKARVLQELGSDFQLNNLSPDTAKGLAQKLTEAGSNGAYSLATLFVNNHLNPENMPVFTGNAAKSLILGLAVTGEEGATCLQQLLANGKLDLVSMPIFQDNEAKSLGQSLSATGEKGATCLQQLFINDKLTNLCFLDANATKDFAQKLANDGPDGAFHLAKLLMNSHLNSENMPVFTGNAAKNIVLSWAKISHGEKYLQRLLANDKLDLDSMPNLQDSEAKDLVQDLATDGEGGLECLEQLLSKLPDLQPTTARRVVQNLIEAEPDGTKCLVELFKNGKLKNLRLMGVSSQDVIELLEQKPSNVNKLENYLYPC